MGILTSQYYDFISKSIINYITTNPTYLVGGNPIPWDDELNPPVETTAEISLNDLKNTLVSGIKVYESDIAYLIDRNTWTADVIYDQYDFNTVMDEKTFYIINRFNDVYKCLSNNNGVPSEFEPISRTLNNIELPDGYVWKYVFSLDEAALDKFGSDTYIPITANTTVTSSSVPGTIDAYQVKSSSNNFFMVSSGAINEVVSSSIFRIENSASSNLNFYVNSLMYIESGAGAGAYSIVNGSYANSSGRYVTLASPLPADTTSNYLISPQAIINGDGTGARAIVYIDEINHKIDRLIPISNGSNYTSADVTIITNSSFTIDYEILPLISPISGHGSDPVQELLSKRLCITSGFQGTVEDLIRDMKYRQLALVSQPKDFSNNFITSNTITYAVTANIASGSFEVGDIISTNTANASVYFANSSIIKLVNVNGDFANGNVISNGEEVATISNVQQPDANKLTGGILYYNNSQPINRSDSVSEQIRLIINF